MTTYGALKTWTREYSDLYLQQMNKRQKQRRYGGGVMPIHEHTKVGGAMQRITVTGAINIHQALVVGGTMGRFTAHIVGTS